ncbi:hypothetical protein ACJZ2D_002099 [Fusarium nematophilum]
MVMRRPHTKSRTGCYECKRRKVKCDEVYPSCFNCTRRGAECSIGRRSRSPRTGSNPAPSARSTSASLSSTPADTSSASGSFHLGFSPGLMPSLFDDDSPAVDISDASLELMHHYSTVTADTFAMRPDMRHVWRAVVPETGYRFPFVTRGVLAAAALHKAHLLPGHRNRYLNMAAYHQTLGLKGFRAALSNVDEDNWRPSFCFSSMVVLCVFSMPRWSDDCEASEVLKIFVMVRGLRATLRPCQAQLIRTQFAPWSYGVWIINEDSAADGDDPSLDNCQLPRGIFTALSRLSVFFDAELPEASRTDYGNAVVQLRKAARLIARAGNNVEVGMVMFFPYVISESVSTDIHAGNPVQVLVLARLV